MVVEAMMKGYRDDDMVEVTCKLSNGSEDDKSDEVWWL